MSQSEILTVHAGEGKYRLTAAAARAGADWVVVITGGDKPHVGAVAAACHTPGVNHADHTTCTVSVITLPGHKEDEIARNTVRQLAQRLHANVVVSAGMHWDNITPEGIDTVIQNSEHLPQALIAAIQDLTPSKELPDAAKP